MAADYRGGPSKLIVFGHPGGANVGSVVAFGEVAPSAGCVAPGTAARVGALVTWEGDFLLAPMFDDALKADSSFGSG